MPGQTWHADIQIFLVNSVPTTQAELIDALSPEQKVEAALRLYWSARELKRAALQAQHPEWTDKQLDLAVRKAFLYASG